MGKTYKRRHYYINKKFQGKFILKFVVASGLAVFGALLMFYILAQNRIDELLYSMSISRGFTSVFMLFFKEMLYATVFSVLVIAVALFFTVNSLFNRLSGPLGRLALEFHKLGRCDLRAKARLRSHDEFHEFADDFNEMTGSLRARLMNVRASADELASLLRALEKDPSGKELHERIDLQMKDLEDALGRFMK